MSAKCCLIFAVMIVLKLNLSAQTADKVKARYNYLLYLPDNYDSLKNWPLVIYLHGGSQKGNDLNKLKAYGPPRLIDQGKKFDFIVVSPQCPDGRYWSTENWFDSLYAELLAKYRVDTNRVYLTGISMGGYGTYITAMDHPGKFAALLALCGGCNDSDTSRICNLRNIPIWAFHGTADDIVSINETKRIVNRLEQCKGNIKFTPLENEGHGIQFIYEQQDIYDWMLAQRRK
jgi:predicted peptidase